MQEIENTYAESNQYIFADWKHQTVKFRQLHKLPPGQFPLQKMGVIPRGLETPPERVKHLYECGWGALKDNDRAGLLLGEMEYYANTSQCIGRQATFSSQMGTFLGSSVWLDYKRKRLLTAIDHAFIHGWGSEVDFMCLSDRAARCTVAEAFFLPQIGSLLVAMGHGLAASKAAKAAERALAQARDEEAADAGTEPETEAKPSRRDFADRQCRRNHLQ